MRCSGLQGRLQQSGIEIDRSGSGKIVEIYPGASLRLWGFDTAGYRANEDARAELLTTIEHSVPWLNLGSHRELMIRCTDAFDAVIASLATRAAAINQYLPPPKEFLEIAKVEGWIALPKGLITDLLL
jgi:predicted nuclease with RNAse H fold